MRILLLCHSFNSLTQRLHVELRQREHEVSVEFDINETVTRDAVALFRPDLVIASFLKRSIPEDVWRNVRCLVVHPGVRGDRGPSALDWAILDDRTRWGVTLIEAVRDMDAGPVWAWREFPMRAATKGSLYRNEVTEAAVACVLEALTRTARGETPSAQRTWPDRPRPLCQRSDRTLDLAHESTETILRVVRSADGDPGAAATVFGQTLRIFDAHPAPTLRGSPGRVLAKSGPAVGVATADGAVWIGHTKPEGARRLKLPVTHLFASEAACLPETPGYPTIAYAEEVGVGYLSFPFYNGAMGTQACRDLLAAYDSALARPTRVLVLMGGEDYWSNGLHLGLIEAASSPADESWANINAIDDLVRAIICTQDRLVVSTVRGNAGAGGFFLAIAADEVWMRESVICSPHYKDMGNLYGSEYWTYLLPQRTGKANAERLTQARWPMGIAEAERLGLVQRRLPADREQANAAICHAATALARSPDFAARLAAKQALRRADEAACPLDAYRAAELDCMRRNFYGFDPSYHVARYNFIRKIGKSHTPLTLAVHRSRKRRSS